MVLRKLLVECMILMVFCLLVENQVVCKSGTPYRFLTVHVQIFLSARRSTLYEIQESSVFSRTMQTFSSLFSSHAMVAKQANFPRQSRGLTRASKRILCEEVAFISHQSSSREMSTPSLCLFRTSSPRGCIFGPS